MPTTHAQSARNLVHTFSAISAALNLRQPLATTLDLITEQVARTLRHRFCAIALYDEDNGSFSIRGSYGLSQEYLDEANKQLRDQIERDGIARAQSVTVRAFCNRIPVQVDDIATDPTFGDWRKLAKLAGYSSAVFLPLVFRDEPIGALSCYDLARTYSAADVDALRPVAAQTATAVGIARLLERQQDSIEALERTTREVDERNRILRETADATRTLTHLLLRHCSLDELVGELHRRLGSPVVLCDEKMRTLARSTPIDHVIGGFDGHTGEIVVPVDGADVVHGYLVVEGFEGARTEVTHPLLEQAAMACALYFMREEAASERELRVASQLLHDLLNRSGPATEINRLTSRLHLDDNVEYRILTVTPVPALTRDGTGTRHRIQAVLTALRQLGEYRGGRRPAAHAPLGHGVVALVPDPGSPDDLARAVREVLKESITAEEEFQVGVSRTCRHGGDFQRRYHELRTCEDLATQAPASALTVIAEHWHVHTMLMRNADDDDIRGRAHELLDPVLADSGGGRLLISIRSYLDTHMNVAHTANTLSVHPNTVKYRLRKLERLTGLTVDRLQHLIELQLALALHDLDPSRFQAEAHAATASASPRPCASNSLETRVTDNRR